MSFEYKVLTDDGKAQMLLQRRAQLEQEHYQHQMLIDQAAALPADAQVALPSGQVVSRDEAIANSEQAQATIETAADAIDTSASALQTASPDVADTTDVLTSDGTDDSEPAAPVDPVAS